MEIENIESDYLKDKSFSYGGKYRIYEHLGKQSKAKVDEALKNSDIYTRYFPYRRPKKYSPIYVDNKRELWQSDLIAFTNKEYADENDGYLYLFATIDVFSKYAWVYKLKNKECKTVMECFKDLLTKCGKKPQRIQTDRGNEFVCKNFKKFLKEKNIHHYVSFSDRKCPVIERFNLTIQMLLYKIIDQNNTLRWIDHIDTAMKIYLNRKHRTIGMSPTAAELPKNESIVRQNLYKYFFQKRNTYQKPKYKVGDTVRVWKYRRNFQRGYDAKFTTEHFTISKVLTNLPVVRYKIKDFNGDEILGSYFQEELVPYNEPELYKTIVLDKKGRGKNEMFLIKYLGWDDKYNRWVKASELTNLNDSVDERNLDQAEAKPLNHNFYQNYDIQVHEPIQPTYENSDKEQIRNTENFGEETVNLPALQSKNNVNEDNVQYSEQHDLNDENENHSPENFYDSYGGLPTENQNVNGELLGRSIDNRLKLNVVDDESVPNMLDLDRNLKTDKESSNNIKRLKLQVTDDKSLPAIYDLKRKSKTGTRIAKNKKQNFENVFQSSTRGSRNF